MKKKILILGGKPIGSVELTERCKQRELYTIVTDYLPLESSPAKQIADEVWGISTSDVNVLADKCKEKSVDGIMTAVHEFNINRMIDLCELLGLPCYCNRNTWKYCGNKLEFKKMCVAAGIDVARKYNIETAIQHLNTTSDLVVVKPVDGSGSRGFSICKTARELALSIENAKQFSRSKRVIIEDYIPFDAVIIHYTMHRGRCFFSGITDKYSVRFPSTGASVMGLQLMPSRGMSQYLKTVDSKARQMFESAGFTDGPIWIEAFYDGDERFIFNEMGYRLGGSMTNYPVQYYYQIDQMDLMIDVAMGDIKDEIEAIHINSNKQYCILPIHIHPGKIVSIEGLDKLKKDADINAIAQVHYVGDEIEEWGSAQQVFCYVHILFENSSELITKIKELMNTLQIKDENNQNMLYTLYDINSIKSLC